MNLGPTELIIILVIVLVLFGSTRLPKLARSMGQASKEFKKGIDEGEKPTDEDKPEKPEKKEDSA
jgi:sec-independent protein translocase protein TatA